MVKKSEIRELINNVKNNPQVRQKIVFLGLINYYLGGVTKKDFDDIRV